MPDFILETGNMANGKKEDKLFDVVKLSGIDGKQGNKPLVHSRCTELQIVDT